MKVECNKLGCGANSLKDDKYCFWHSSNPAVVKKRKQARERGGSRGKLQCNDAIESVADVKRVLTETINELRSSGTQNVVGKARATGYLCSILLVSIEKGDLEERIAKLEELLTTDTT